ncbi:hypothetical protein [Nitrosospira sp. Nl5]|uniref:hypothetical protein n=1 Tax=Nitrosospira sp. Nl5 TaxID=200120 RepID=UPI001C40A579|nr:hypothetical protein [Nitrosospira sp. Nl5]
MPTINAGPMGGKRAKGGHGSMPVFIAGVNGSGASGLDSPPDSWREINRVEVSH